MHTIISVALLSLLALVLSENTYKCWEQVVSTTDKKKNRQQFVNDITHAYMTLHSQATLPSAWLDRYKHPGHRMWHCFKNNNIKIITLRLDCGKMALLILTMVGGKHFSRQRIIPFILRLRVFAVWMTTRSQAVVNTFYFYCCFKAKTFLLDDKAYRWDQIEGVYLTVKKSNRLGYHRSIDSRPFLLP